MAELVSALLPLFPAVPLVAAALALLAPWRGVRDSIMLVIPGVGIFAGFALLLYTMNNGVVAHTVGLYPGNAGIAFAADTFSALMIVTTMIVAFGANWFAIVGGETKSRYYASLTLILVTGVCGALLTADLFNFFVFIEVMLLPSYGLITMSGTWSRLAAGRAFVLVNLFASTLLVVGVGYIYSVTGVVNLAALESAAAGNGPVTVASGIVVIAIAAKAMCSLYSLGCHARTPEPPPLLWACSRACILRSRSTCSTASGSTSLTWTSAGAPSSSWS